MVFELLLKPALLKLARVCAMEEAKQIIIQNRRKGNTIKLSTYKIIFLIHILSRKLLIVKKVISKDLFLLSMI